MSRFLIYGLLAAFLSPFFSAKAQPVPTAPGQRLPLAQALDATVRNYPALKAQLADQAAVREETASVRASYMPSLNWQNQALFATSNQVRGTYYTNEGTAIPSSGTVKVNGNTADAVWTSFSTLLVNWKAVTFGKYKADLNVARANESVAESAYEQALFEQRIQTADAYLLTLIFDQAVSIQRANLSRVLAFQTVLTAGARAGLRPGVDSALAAAEVSKARLLLLDSQRIAQSQRLRLGELTGLSAMQMVLDTGTFARPPKPPVFRGDTSLAANPILRFYQRQIDYRAARQLAIRQSFWPTLSVLGAVWGRGSGISDRPTTDGNYQYDPSLGAGLPFRAYNYMAGVTMNWRVSDIFRIRHDEQAQRYRTQRAHYDYDVQALRLKTQQQTADLQLTNAYEALQQVPIQLGAALAAFGQANARYGAGLNTLLELTQATNVLNRAEIDQSVAINNVWRYRLLKAAADGTIDAFINLTTQP